MPQVGDVVLVHARGGWYPYVWCGRVAEIYAPNAYKLIDPSLLPHTREVGVTWEAVAAGDQRARRAMRVRTYRAPVEVYDVCYCVPWVGDLPTKDQH